MRIERIWAMSSLWTFTIKPIRELLADEVTGDPMKWCDPFAGYNSPAGNTNDLDAKSPATNHQDALDYLKAYPDSTFEGILYDPPYSITQARNYGKKEYASMKYWKQCKDEVTRILKPGGKVICFGWNTMGCGKGRGFEMQRILIVPHGGSKNDTLVTVEIKL